MKACIRRPAERDGGDSPVSSSAGSSRRATLRRAVIVPVHEVDGSETAERERRATRSRWCAVGVVPSAFAQGARTARPVEQHTSRGAGDEAAGDENRARSCSTAARAAGCCTAEKHRAPTGPPKNADRAKSRRAVERRAAGYTPSASAATGLRYSSRIQSLFSRCTKAPGSGSCAPSASGACS